MTLIKIKSQKLVYMRKKKVVHKINLKNKIRNHVQGILKIHTFELNLYNLITYFSIVNSLKTSFTNHSS